MRASRSRTGRVRSSSNLEYWAADQLMQPIIIRPPRRGHQRNSAGARFVIDGNITPRKWIYSHQMPAKSTLIAPKDSDKRYVRRNEKGRFNDEQVNVRQVSGGRSTHQWQNRSPKGSVRSRRLEEVEIKVLTIGIHPRKSLESCKNQQRPPSCRVRS